MAELSKKALQKAYNAGKHSLTIVWGPDATDDQRRPGMHHCPFPEGDPQRDEWARGLADALGGDRYDPATILREVRDEIRGGDRVSSR